MNQFKNRLIVNYKIKTSYIILRTIIKNLNKIKFKYKENQYKKKLEI